MSRPPIGEIQRRLAASGLRRGLHGVLQVRVDPVLGREAWSRQPGRGPSGPQREHTQRTREALGTPSVSLVTVSLRDRHRYRLDEHIVGEGLDRAVIRDGSRQWFTDERGEWEEFSPRHQGRYAAAPLRASGRGRRKGTQERSPEPPPPGPGIESDHEILAFMLYPAQLFPDEHPLYQIEFQGLERAAWRLQLIPVGGTDPLLWPGADRVSVTFAPSEGILRSTQAYLGTVVYAESRWIELQLGAEIDPSVFRPPPGSRVRRRRL